MASRYSHGVQRVLAKLEASINSENYYEAHQMYRTLYFRWESADPAALRRRVAPSPQKFYPPLTSSARRYLSQRKYSELLELLYNGSMLLLQHEQVRAVRSRVASGFSCVSLGAISAISVDENARSTSPCKSQLTAELCVSCSTQVEPT